MSCSGTLCSRARSTMKHPRPKARTGRALLLAAALLLFVPRTAGEGCGCQVLGYGFPRPPCLLSITRCFPPAQLALCAVTLVQLTVHVSALSAAIALQSSTPAANAVGVSPSASISLTFDVNVEANSGNIRLTPQTPGEGSEVVIAIIDTTQVSFSSNVVSISPSQPLVQAVGTTT